MRKLLILSALVLFSLSSFSQGIKFFEGKFDDAMAKAKAEKKMLFVDFYTVWCGPCKSMKENIFPQKKVGDFFNKKFISIQIDAEKGEGIKISKKYKVSAYPTMIFFNADDGSENKRLVGATPNATFFINYTKQVTGDAMSFLEMYKKYEAGNRNLDFIREIILNGPVYAQGLKRGSEEQTKWYRKIGEIVQWYFAIKQPNQMVNQKDFSIIAMYLDGPNNNNPYVEYVYNNYEAFKKVVPIKDLAMFIYRTNNQSIHDSYGKGNLNFRAYLEQIHGRLAKVYADDPEADANDTYLVMKYVAEAGYALNANKDVQSYLDWSDKYFEYQKSKGELRSHSYTNNARTLLARHKDLINDKFIKRLMKQIKAGLKAYPNDRGIIETIADCQVFTGDKKNALKNYQKVLELVKGQRGEDYFTKAINKKIEEMNK